MFRIRVGGKVYQVDGIELELSECGAEAVPEALKEEPAKPRGRPRKTAEAPAPKHVKEAAEEQEAPAVEEKAVEGVPTSAKEIAELKEEALKVATQLLELGKRAEVIKILGGLGGAKVSALDAEQSVKFLEQAKAVLEG